MSLQLLAGRCIDLTTRFIQLLYENPRPSMYSATYLGTVPRPRRRQT